MSALKNRILLPVLCISSLCFSKEVPVRLDIHLAGGVAYPWAGLRDFFPITALLDIDGKALIKKSDVQSRVSKKYRRFLGDEIYVGHILIPNTLAFSYSGTDDAWDGYIDWNLIGLTLLKYPKKKHYSAPVSFRLNISLLAAYHVLSNKGLSQPSKLISHHSHRASSFSKSKIQLALLSPRFSFTKLPLRLICLVE